MRGPLCNPRPVNVSAIIVAAGSGARMGTGLPKALVPIGGRPLVSWSCCALSDCPGVGEIVIVAPPAHLDDMATAIGTDGHAAAIVAGGATRAESVAAGLNAIADAADVVLVHDAARPLIASALVARVLAALDGADGAIAAAPVTDTLKRVREDLTIDDTVDRSDLWQAQTPQAFRRSALERAYRQLDRATVASATDCASLLHVIGAVVRVVPSTVPNIKVTLPGDVALVEALLAARG